AKFAILARYGVDYAGIVNSEEHVVAEFGNDSSLAGLPVRYPNGLGPGPYSTADQETPRDRGTKLVDIGKNTYVLARADALLGGKPHAVWVASKLPANLSASLERLNEQSTLYAALSRERKLVRQTYLSILLLLTILILFIATWFALFLSRQVT